MAELTLMNEDWQTWTALAVVTVAAVLLVRSALGRRNHDDGCGCPGAKNSRELAKFKKRVSRNG